MKTAFQKIATCLLALLVLGSTLSFTVDMHYCGDQLVDYAVLQHAKGCGMDMSSDSNREALSKEQCCSDEQLIVEGQDELSTAKEHTLKAPQSYILVSFALASLNLFKDLENVSIPFKDYHPPLIIPDILREQQTFLI